MTRFRVTKSTRETMVTTNKKVTKRNFVSCSLMNILLLVGVLEVIGFHLYFYFDQLMIVRRQPNGVLPAVFIRFMNEHGYWLSNTTAVYYTETRYNDLSNSLSLSSSSRTRDGKVLGHGGGVGTINDETTMTAPIYPMFNVSKRRVAQSSSSSPAVTQTVLSKEEDIQITITKLRHMMNATQIEFEHILYDYVNSDNNQETNPEQKMLSAEQIQSTIPRWSQIISNYGPDPVILGTERCESYRNTVPLNERLFGPAGLFSTGTNVLHALLEDNCHRPKNRLHGKFHVWQVPWGKHNPSIARQHYAAPNYEHRNQTAVLPIVSIRHPITWMYALCLHSYNLVWYHHPDQCNETLNLHRPVNARFGAAKHTMYKSLLHVWRDWNLLYYEQRNYPLLMIRHDDLIYRPEQVVKTICDCVGGSYLVQYKGGENDLLKRHRHKKKKRKKLEEQQQQQQHQKLEPRLEAEDIENESGSEIVEEIHHEFVYFSAGTATHGRGHGQHRSDLLSAWIKYGQPIESVHRKSAHKLYTNQDWKVIKSVFNDDHGLLDAFHYLP